MNRTTCQQIAEERAQEAKVLLDAGKWSGAYYLVGYAVECGLKACILAHVEQTGVIFRERKFSESCWTHNPKDLVKLAGLDSEWGLAIQSNPVRSLYWDRVCAWIEASRYELKSQQEALELYEAVTDANNGVLPWIRSRW